MDVLLDSGLLMDPAVLAVLTESGPGGKKRRKVVIPKPRRGELEGHGQVRWRIPIQPGVWEELERDGVDDPSSWAGKRFRSIFGVPKAIYDELVQEARQHKVLCGKNFHGDGMRGPFSKPVELKVAALLEMCQAGLVFKTVDRLYKISVPAMQRFFHDFMQLQVQHEYAKHVYYPRSKEAIERTLFKHDLLGFPGTITMFDGVKFEHGACPL